MNIMELMFVILIAFSILILRAINMKKHIEKSQSELDRFHRTRLQRSSLMMWTEKRYLDKMKREFKL